MADQTADPARRPIPYRQAADISVSSGSQEGSESRCFLKTPSGGIFTFGEHEHFLWTSLDGSTSFSDIEQAFFAKFGLDLTPSHLAEFIAHGVDSRLIEHCGKPGEMFSGDFDRPAARRTRIQTDRKRKPPQGRHAHIGKEPFTLILGDPTRLFAFLAVVCRPLCYVKWLVFPGALFGSMILLKNAHAFQSDWRTIVASVPWWPCMYLYEHTLNIIARIAEGTIIQAQGGTVRYFGVRFLLCVIMRGFIDEHAVKGMPKRVRIWSKAGPLLLRLGLFDIMSFAWIEVRQAHPSAALPFLFVAVLSFILMCVNACPLVLAEGYELLATALNQQHLAVRAYRFVGIRLSGRPPPPAMGATEIIGLIFFAVGSLLANGYIIFCIIIDMGGFMTTDIQGLGYLFMTSIFLGSVLYIVALTHFTKKGTAARRAFAADARKNKFGKTTAANSG